MCFDVTERPLCFQIQGKHITKCKHYINTAPKLVMVLRTVNSLLVGFKRYVHTLISKLKLSCCGFSMKAAF